MSDGRPSKWSLLHPKWLLLLAVLIGVCITMVLLGRWQWRAARHHGDLTNYSYACQWWAFTVFAVIMYARIIRDHLRKPADRPVVPAQEQAPVNYLAYVAPASTAQAERDPERVRMNNYLASLYAADEKAADEKAADEKAAAEKAADERAADEKAADARRADGTQLSATRRGSA